MYVIFSQMTDRPYHIFDWDACEPTFNSYSEAQEYIEDEFQGAYENGQRFKFKIVKIDIDECEEVEIDFES